jgi:hypothetical protein
MRIQSSEMSAVPADSGRQLALNEQRVGYDKQATFPESGNRQEVSPQIANTSPAVAFAEGETP